MAYSKYATEVKDKNNVVYGYKDKDHRTYDNLKSDVIEGTTQTIAFDSAGNVQSITHKQGNTTVRTDVFTFAANSITEVRTLASGESLTIVTNTDTLVTTVTYSAA